MDDYSQLVLLERCKNYAVIRFNRPERRNAVIGEMYELVIQHLNSLADDNSTKLVVFTGTGAYYTSGADFATQSNNESEPSPGKRKSKHKSGRSDMFRLFVEALIKFPKPIFAAVNGPAIGIGVTMLALMDVVYASDSSTFLTPFSRIGAVPEACSTYTFPKLMGYAKANEILLFNRTFNASEALEAGLVSDVFPQRLFWSEVQKRIDEYLDLPMKSMLRGKRLVRRLEVDRLLDVNNMECERSKERWSSEDMAIQAKKFREKRKAIRAARRAKL